MITIVYGVPGSGKTYYSVWLIRKKALEEGDIFFRVRKDVILITNLKLNLDSMDNYIYIEEWEGWKKYMDVDFWKVNLAYIQGKKIMMVMDEAQVFFKLYGDDARVLFFLQYHRHLSVDVLLITQSPKSLPGKVFELAEFLIEAVPKSVNPFAFRAFRYRVLHPFDRDVVLRRFHLPFDSVVFYLYSDMIYKPDEDEGDERPKNVFIHYYFLLSFFLLLTVFLMFSFLSRVFSPSSSQAKAQSSPSVSLQSYPVLSYEDLITEVEEEKPTVQEKPLEEKPKSKEDIEDIPLPSEGAYRIVVEKDSPKIEEEPLKPEPKIIYLP